MKMIHAYRTPIALVANVTFLAGMFPSRGWAAEGKGAARVEIAERSESSVSEETKTAPVRTRKPTDDGMRAIAAAARTAAMASDPSAPPAQATPTPGALPAGGDKSGVSGKAISVPQGAGKILGMGESFSAQLSTGGGSFTIPIALLPARGGADPSLQLSYSSSSGHGVAGVGWDVGVPFIARQTDRGLPLYDDRGAWHPNQDRFVFNGGQELVPICAVTGATCASALRGEVMPSWSDGYQYFRSRVEGGFLRFFWSADHRTWRVQSKTGETLELGAPLDGSTATGSVETDPAHPARIFRWNLARQYDAEGEANPAGSAPPRPVNLVVYRYLTDGGQAYLSDVYDTPPAVNAATADVATYAHHTRLRYERRPDATVSYRRGWPVEQAVRLAGIDVTSKPSTGGASAFRELVRRYHLTYDPAYHVSLLAQVQLEGRCAGASAEGAGEALPVTTGCPMLPPVQLGYQHVVPYDTKGVSSRADLAGFEGFDERVTMMAKSPPHSLDDAMTDLFDINADGLPDVLVTSPGLYGGKHGVFFNGGEGQADSFRASTMAVMGVVTGSSVDTSGTITLGNLNVSAGDVDGDGVVDLAHMPQVKTYSIYSPERLGSDWLWRGHNVTTASAQSPKINLGRDGADTQRMDVNGDGLVDVVLTQGTEIETFFALGKFAGGDGQFGQATWTAATAARISNEPVAACAPYAGLPVWFSDSDVKVGDMNGDGLPDIVRVRQGEVRYWPGRGNGMWGTGAIDDCPRGTFGAGRDVAMASSPEYGDPNGSGLHLDDVNGDGLDDLVQVRFQDVDVWLNVDGTGWSPRHTIAGTPAAPATQNRVRLVDINGSGTRDILWGDGNQYRYIDLAGGARPWILTHIANGLGKTSDIEYTSSTALMLAAEKAGTPWTSLAPMPIHVVTKVIDSDNLHLIGRRPGLFVTDYSYANPVYDGRQREFRGFRTALATREGDANSPTATTESTFLLGECKAEGDASAPSPCTLDGRWRDNPREALKGLPLSSDTFDETGVYQSTMHHTYRLRRLYSGLDGREVRHAFEVAGDTYLYDTAGTDHAASSVVLGDVELELAPPIVSAASAIAPFTAMTADTTSSLVLHGTVGRAHVQSRSVVDAFGNATQGIALGCVDGCGGADAPDDTAVDETITSYSIPLQPAGDASGWIWRTGTVYVVGASDHAERHRAETTFDSTGKPVGTSMKVTGSLPLDRFTEDGRGVAPPPTDASQDGVVQTSGTTYDAFGGARQVTAANGRVREVDYDPTYADLAITERVFVGAPGSSGRGATVLASTAEYDRGLGVVVAVHDLHGELSTAEYDGFGRLTKLWKPDPDRVGAVSAAPSVIAEYLLPPSDAIPYTRVHTRTQDGPDGSVASYHEAWAFADGLGRALLTLTQADPGAGDGGAWIANGLTSYDSKGAAERAYLAWFSDKGPDDFDLTIVPPGPYGRQRYDAFGRQLQTFGLDGTVTLQSVYHALSADKWDAADLQPGPHQGSYASGRQDGHGRAVSATERSHVNGKLEAHQTRTRYLATGEPAVIERIRVGSADPHVVRWMRYDTAGRMVLNVEPDTTKGFNPNPSTDASTMKAWRYAYNDSGDLVGTSDARGCGVNYHYDRGGRILAEDYSPCRASQALYSPYDPTTGNGAEVLNRYDSADPELTSPACDPGSGGLACATNGGASQPVGFTIDPALLLGRLVSTSDRGAKTVMQYDGRGRVAGMARRIASPSAVPGQGPYAPRWYFQRVTFDGADRPLSETSGVVDAAASPEEVKTVVTTDYTKRGLVRSVGSNFGTIVTRTVHDADGLAQVIEYGDIATTTTAFSYDNRRRLASVQTYRGPPPLWSATSGGITPAPSTAGAPTTLQLLLEDSDFAYDAVDNPTEIRDWRLPDEWPSGAKPVTRKMQYDDLYRLSRIDYQATDGADAWTSPFASENAGASNTRRAAPSPHQGFDARTQWQTFQYDWLGNTVVTKDDARGFFDRSLGTITNGGAASGPYQLKSATNATSTPGSPSREGRLSAAYDDAGYLTTLDVRRDGPCLPAEDGCSQHFTYQWDEVGRLARARRWDTREPAAAIETAGPQADLQYTYDGNDDRVVKRAVDPTVGTRYSLYPFDAYELRGTSWREPTATIGADYVRDREVEVPYLFAHGVRLGRVEQTTEDDLPSLTSGATHVFLELMDHLGSTGLVVDMETSELVEAATYQAYGAAESDYRPERWKGFREDYRFTGKEEDIEVGLQYFGKRYYAPALGRWVSADPLAIHGLTADANVYAYVHGAVLKAVDPTGLDESTLTSDPKVDGNTSADGNSSLSSDEAVSSAPAASAIADPSLKRDLSKNAAMTLGLPENLSSLRMTNPFTEGLANQGKTKLAAIWEAGYACSGCHLTHFGHDTDDQIDLEKFAYHVQVNAYTKLAAMGLGGVSAAYDIGTSGRMTDPASRAASFQGRAPYWGLDDWHNVVLPKGTKVAAGAPGVSGFATTLGTIAHNDFSAPKLFGAVQVQENARFGYRPGMTVFVMKEDTPAAFATTKQNHQFGPGGAPQFYVPNLEDAAEAAYSVVLKREKK
jgi:RHS repeat-associated protein